MVTDPSLSIEDTGKCNGRVADRRARHRAVVRWPVELWKIHEHILDTCTVNISSNGFLCICSQPFSPGEMLTALLEIPGCLRQGGVQKLVLRCDVLALRVERIVDSCDCGIAWRILDYSVLRDTRFAVGAD